MTDRRRFSQRVWLLLSFFLQQGVALAADAPANETPTAGVAPENDTPIVDAAPANEAPTVGVAPENDGPKIDVARPDVSLTVDGEARSAAASGGLNADDCVRRALEKSARLESLRHRIDEEEGPRTLGLLLKNPQVRVTHRRIERAWTSGTTPAALLDDVSAGVRVPIPAISAMGFAQAERAHHVDATRADLDDARHALAAEVRILHAEVVNLDAHLALAQDELALSEKLVELVKGQSDAGLATRFDENAAVLDRFDAVIEIEELRAARRTSLTELEALIDWPVDEPLTLTNGVTPACEATVVEVDDDRVVAMAPEIRALDARIAEEEAAKFVAYTKLVPWARFLQLDYRLGPTRLDDTVEIRTAFTLPVLNFEQDELRTRSARIARLEAERRDVAHRIRGDLRRQRDDVLGQQAIASIYNDASTTLVNESTMLVEESLRMGQGDPAALARVNARTLKARRNALRTQFRCESAKILLGERGGTDPVVTTTGPTLLR